MKRDTQIAHGRAILPPGDLEDGLKPRRLMVGAPFRQWLTR
jgi:hypothetical protein